jgi:hypothetical protein
MYGAGVRQPRPVRGGFVSRRCSRAKSSRSRSQITSSPSSTVPSLCCGATASRTSGKWSVRSRPCRDHSRTACPRCSRGAPEPVPLHLIDRAAYQRRGRRQGRGATYRHLGIQARGIASPIGATCKEAPHLPKESGAGLGCLRPEPPRLGGRGELSGWRHRPGPRLRQLPERGAAPTLCAHRGSPTSANWPKCCQAFVPMSRRLPPTVIGLLPAAPLGRGQPIALSHK